MAKKKHNILIDPSQQRAILDLRTLGFNDVVVLGRYHYESARDPLEFHSHGDMIEIVYLYEGWQNYKVDECEYQLTSGDIFVTWPNERHGSGDSPEGRGTLFWMLLQKPKAGESFLSLPHNESELMWESLDQLPSRHFHAGEGLEILLRRVFDVYACEENPLRTIEVRNALEHCLLEIISASLHGKAQVDQVIRQSIEMIANIRDRIPELRELANATGLSLSRFKLRFKQETGISPNEYIMRHKVETACDLLVEEKCNVTDIAFDLGFSSSQYFATIFKKHMGVTPSVFRAEKMSTEKAE